MISKGYRENVAAIIINKDKKVLMCEHAWIDDAWQLPQGGIEEGESEQEAIVRELYEELGTKSFKVIDKMDHKIKYQLPYYLKEKFHNKGQEQRYFLLYFYGEDKEIRFDNQAKPEFKSFEWVDYEEPSRRVIYFKKLAYYKALEYFKDKVEKLDMNNI